jgi:DNA-binding transcriptional ArsR family regulator
MPEIMPDELLSLVAKKFKLLGDATRLVLLQQLMAGEELTVRELTEKSGREFANVSKHLKQMAEAGMLSRRREGSFVHYRLDDPVLEKICHLVCRSLQHDLETELKKTKRLLKKVDPKSAG